MTSPRPPSPEEWEKAQRAHRRRRGAKAPPLRVEDLMQRPTTPEEYAERLKRERG